MYVQPIAEAKAPVQLAQNKIRPPVVAFFRLISPLYMKAALGFSRVRLVHGERLAQAYADFFQGKTRLLIAFRHPYGDEAQLMAYVIGRLIAKEAKARGVKLGQKPHAHFVHGYEVPLWAGAFERWLLPRVGALPVYHAKFDSLSIKRIRSLMKDGQYPIALAPEGQVSYSSEEAPRLESGAARICLWCAEDLHREGRSEDVVLLPISIQQRWPKATEKSLDALIAAMEGECGLAQVVGETSRFERLKRLGEAVLAAAEHQYRHFYGAELPDSGELSSAQRLSNLRQAALATAEHCFHLKPEGDEIRRVYRIRQTGWDRIFRTDLTETAVSHPTSALHRSMADRLAGEAWYASRHMELVDLAYYLDLDRLKLEDPLELYIETAQNYYDWISRLKGGNISHRKNLRPKEGIVIVATPLSVAQTLKPLGLQTKPGKAATEALNQALMGEFLACIEEIWHARVE
jgi:hypothetical protein